MPRLTLVAAHIIRALCLLLLLTTCVLTLHSQTVLLRTDADSATAQTVVHLTATSPVGTGTVTFYDGTSRIAAVPLSAGSAVVGTATLAAGTHTLTAVIGTGTSAPVTVTVQALPSTGAQLTADQPYAFPQTNAHLTFSGLPTQATGNVVFSEGATTLATVPLSFDTPTYYQAFGDSITAGAHLQPSARYANLFVSAMKLNEYINYANSGAITCDVLTTQILPSGLQPTQNSLPLSSLMIGTSDMDLYGTGAYETNYQTCHSAVLAWLGIPREYKVLPGDAAAQILFGSWTSPPPLPVAPLDHTYGTLYNSSGAGAASFTLTSNGPLYLWYLIADHLAGSFTVALDGVPTGVVYQTNPTTPIGSLNNPDSAGIALLRLSSTPGRHVLTVTVLSGTVGLLGAATPPSPEAATTHPTVLITDIPNQRSTDAKASLASIARYSADAFADAQQLQADGLDIRTIATHSFLLGEPDEFLDFGHPNELGQQHLEDALFSVFGQASTTPYATMHTYGAVADVPVPTLGKHTYTATYSGDSTYAPISASVTVTGVPPSQSITALSAVGTTFYAGDAIRFVATVFPPNSSGIAVSLLEGTRPIATASLTGSTATFAVSSLAPGIHVLHAYYAGDNTNAASVSPDLPIQILQLPSTLALTASAAELAPADALFLTGTISPAAATGKVTFTDLFTAAGQSQSQTRALGDATLAGSTVQVTLTALAPGTHALTAVYQGDLNDQPARPTTVTVLVDPYATATTLSATPATTYGNSITFTAHVSAAGATGTLTFFDSVSGISIQMPLAGSTATWTTSALSAARHGITAEYSGDATYATSTSAPLTTIVAPRPSASTIVVPTGTLYTNKPVLLTAIVTPADATGTIAFLDTAGGMLGQGTIAQGAASFLVPALSPGSHALIAQYSGDAITATSSSPAAPLSVLSTVTGTTLTAPATAVYAAPVTLSATVSPTPASGIIAFYDQGKLLGSTALANGVATFTSPVLAAGTHSLTATFPGDDTHDPSTASATLAITPGAATVSLTFAQPSVLAGSPIVVNVSVATGTTALATGTLTLQSGTTVSTSTLTNGAVGTTYATFTLPTTTAGAYPFTAVYPGDLNTAPASSAAVNYTVTPRVASGTLLLSSAQVPPLTPITVTAAFTAPGGLIPTGTVAFLRGSTTVATAPLDATGQASMTLPAAAIGAYMLSAAYTPTGVFSTSVIPAQLFTVTPPLAIAFTAASIDMTAATTTTVGATLTTLSGFQGALATTCTVPETFLTCTIDAPTMLTGSTRASVHITVLSRLPAPTRSGFLALPLLALLLLLPTLAENRRRYGVLLVLAAATLLGGTSGCATGGNFDKIPAGSHILHLNATAAGITTTADLTVNIK